MSLEFTNLLVFLFCIFTFFISNKNEFYLNRFLEEYNIKLNYSIFTNKTVFKHANMVQVYLDKIYVNTAHPLLYIYLGYICQVLKKYMN